MKPRRLRDGATSAALLLAGAMLGFAACSDNGNPQPNPHFTTSSGPGSGGATTTTSASSANTGGASGTAGGTTGNTGGAGGSDAGTGGSGGNCDGPAGCYDCPPHTNSQFLNQCTNAQCAAFDNAARLPLYNGGNLPPVP
jgi:hypothetical protein